MFRMSIGGPLDKQLPTPLYHQLEEHLKTEIESRAWAAGEQLPNEGKLAERFGVSKITVRQALQNLEDRGYIKREHGRGTFVAKRQFERPRELTSFTEEMRGRDLRVSSRILTQRIVEADSRVADALQIAPGSAVFTLERLRMADSEPLTVQVAHIPAQLVPDLELAPETSLYEVLQRRYDLYPARAKETYFAAAADGPTAELLQIAPGSPVFAVERVTFLPNQKPFEFVRSIVRGDRYSIVLDLEKQAGGLALTNR